MIIVGIDPGTARTGYGVIEKKGNSTKLVAYDLIETAKDLPQPLRLELIYNEVKHIIELFKPDIMGVEKLFFNKNITTAMTVSEARGVIILAAQTSGVEVREYTPSSVKKALTGNGRAEKKQVQQMVEMILHMEKGPKIDDMADALAIAITCGNSNKMEDIIKKNRSKRKANS